jgi:TonB family protein
VTPLRSSSALLLFALAALPARAAFAQPPAQAHAAAVTPPQVLEHVDASYPQSRMGESLETTVVLFVTVEKDGKVSDATVAESGGDDFDEAALAAVKRWRFTPALKGGSPVRARIRVPFHFAPEAHQPAEEPPPKQPPAPPSKPGEAAPPPKEHRPPEAVQELPAGTGLPHAVSEPGKPIEIHVQGRQNPPHQALSDFRLDAQAVNAAPHRSAADLLATAPGVNVTHPEGDVVAQRVYLRGFDADHGQDISFNVGSIPMNQVSHLHGQGYADLNLIIPETVRSIRVIEGVYDPAQGDFSVAGSVDYDLGVQERGARFKGSLGSFGTKRLLALWAPETSRRCSTWAPTAGARASPACSGKTTSTRARWASTTPTATPRPARSRPRPRARRPASPSSAPPTTGASPAPRSGWPTPPTAAASTSPATPSARG